MNTRDQVYESIGVGYAAARRPDPRIYQQIIEALGDAQSVLNVGAGGGNYEPPDRRAAKRQVILLFEPAESQKSWLVEYFPECLALPSETGDPGVDDVGSVLDVQSVSPVPVPSDCTDGFAGAYWARPEAYLDPLVRAGISSLALLAPVDAERGAQRLREDLPSRVWDARFGYLRELPEFELGYRLVVAG